MAISADTMATNLNYTTLKQLNEDCLYEILGYLDSGSLRNLALTGREGLSIVVRNLPLLPAGCLNQVPNAIFQLLLSHGRFYEQYVCSERIFPNLRTSKMQIVFLKYPTLPQKVRRLATENAIATHNVKKLHLALTYEQEPYDLLVQIANEYNYNEDIMIALLCNRHLNLKDAIPVLLRSFELEQFNVIRQVCYSRSFTFMVGEVLLNLALQLEKIDMCQHILNAMSSWTDRKQIKQQILVRIMLGDLLPKEDSICVSLLHVLYFEPPAPPYVKSLTEGAVLLAVMVDDQSLAKKILDELSTGPCIHISLWATKLLEIFSTKGSLAFKDIQFITEQMIKARHSSSPFIGRSLLFRDSVELFYRS